MKIGREWEIFRSAEEPLKKRCGKFHEFLVTSCGLGFLFLGRGKMIQVDETQYTGVGKIYAVGDVAGGVLQVEDGAGIG